MASTHPTNATPTLSTQKLHPQISISISASSPTLNLATRTEFPLTITFTLHNSPRPIAIFKASFPPLLQPLTALTSPGLAFTCNARTGAAAPRPAFFHVGGSHPRCRLGRSHSDDDGGPPYSHEKPLAHLQPSGVPWSVTHSLGPAVLRQPRVWIGADGLPKRVEGPEQAFWFGTAGMEDGNAYEVGLSEEAGQSVKVFEWEGVAWKVITAPVRIAAAWGLVGKGLRRCGEGRWVLKGKVPVVLVQKGEFELRGVSEVVGIVRLWA